MRQASCLRIIRSRSTAPLKAPPQARWSKSSRRTAVRRSSAGHRRRARSVLASGRPSSTRGSRPGFELCGRDARAKPSGCASRQRFNSRRARLDDTGSSSVWLRAQFWHRTVTIERYRPRDREWQVFRTVLLTTQNAPGQIVWTSGEFTARLPEGTALSRPARIRGPTLLHLGHEPRAAHRGLRVRRPTPLARLDEPLATGTRARKVRTSISAAALRAVPSEPARALALATASGRGENLDRQWLVDGSLIPHNRTSPPAYINSGMGARLIIRPWGRTSRDREDAAPRANAGCLS